MAFLELRFDYLHCLSDLTWVVRLVTASQSWLGYWCLVGIGDVEDGAAHAMRKRRRAIHKQRRGQVKQAAATAAAAREKGSSSAASRSGTAGGDSALGSPRRRLGFGAPRSQTGSGSASASAGITGAERNAGLRMDLFRQVGPVGRLGLGGPTAGRGGSGDMSANAGDVELQEVIFDYSGGMRRGSDSGGPRTGTLPPQQHHNAHFEAVLSVSGITTESGSSNPSSFLSDIFTRGLRHLAEIQPAFVKARIDRLRREHVAAARRNARERMDVVERVMGRNPQADFIGLSLAGEVVRLRRE